MRKSIVAVFGVLALFECAFAGQFAWDAGMFPADTYKGGTGYLVQVVNGNPSIDDIYNHIVTHGITTQTPSDFKYWGQSSFVTETGSDFYWFDSVTFSNLDAKEYSGFFTVIFTEDKKTFAIYKDFKACTVDAIKPDAELSFGEMDSFDGWKVGTVGPVPEPTALALLALGVAGLALKRRVA